MATGQLLGLALTFGLMVWILLFVIRGSRPTRMVRGKKQQTKANSWGYMKRYTATGLAARVVVGVPLGWATGEVMHASGQKAMTAFIAAAVIVGLAYTVAGLLEPAVGALVLAIEFYELVTLSDDTAIRALYGVGAVVVLVGVVALGVVPIARSLPLVVAVCLEMLLLSLGMGEDLGGTSAAQLVLTIAIIGSALLLVGVGKAIVLALLGVALAFGSIMALIMLGPDSERELLISLAGMAGALPAAAVTRFLRIGND